MFTLWMLQAVADSAAVAHAVSDLLQSFFPGITDAVAAWILASFHAWPVVVGILVVEASGWLIGKFHDPFAARFGPFWEKWKKLINILLGMFFGHQFAGGAQWGLIAGGVWTQVLKPILTTVSTRTGIARAKTAVVLLAVALAACAGRAQAAPSVDELRAESAQSAILADSRAGWAPSAFAVPVSRLLLSEKAVVDNVPWWGKFTFAIGGGVHRTFADGFQTTGFLGLQPGWHWNDNVAVRARLDRDLTESPKWRGELAIWLVK